MSSSEIGDAQAGIAETVLARGRVALGPAPLGGLLGDVGDLRPVVARMGDEVLQDHLLDVAVPLLHGRQRLQRGDPLLLATRRSRRGSRS